MKKLSNSILVTICVMFATSAIAEVKYSYFDQACVVRAKSGSSVNFSLSNEHDFPLSMKFTVTGENFTSDVSFPYNVAIPTKTMQSLFDVRQRQSGQK